MASKLTNGAMEPEEGDEMLEDEPPEEMGEDGGEPPMEPPEGPPPPQPQQQYQLRENLALKYPLAYLQKVAARVVADADADYESMEPWRRHVAAHTKLYAGEANDNLPPGQPSMTVMHLPFTRRAIRIFHSKLLPQLFPPRPSGGVPEMVGISVISQDLAPVAEKVALDMNLQLYNHIKVYLPSRDRQLVQQLLEGVTYTIWYWDPVDQEAVCEVCLAEDVWIPYKAKVDRVDLGNVPRITWIKRLHQHELEQAEDNQYYIAISQPVQYPDGVAQPIFGEDGGYDESGAPKYQAQRQQGNTNDNPVKEGADRRSGQEKPDPVPDGERELLEQDRWLRLPGERRQTPVTICVDRTTQTVLRLERRQREDLRDKKRWQREMAEHQATVQALNAQHKAASDTWQRGQVRIDVGPDGLPLVQPGPFAGVPQPQPPQMPPEPAPVRMVPWHRWTKSDCQVNPQGALGEGLAHDVAGHNKLANQVATRAVNQMTNAMMPTLLGSRQSRFKRGELKLTMNEINEVDMPPSQAANNYGLVRIETAPPPEQWHKAVELADNSAQELTAFGIVMGAPGMSGETATEAELRHGGASDHVASVGRRFMMSAAQDLKNLAYIFSQTIPDEGRVVMRQMVQQPVPQEVAAAAQQMGMDPAALPPPPPQVEEIRVFREDYEMLLGEMEVTFTCDPNLESKAVKGRKAERMLTVATQVAATPMAALDPVTVITMIRGAIAMVFEAADAPREWVNQIKNAPMPDPQMLMAQQAQGGANANGKPAGGKAGGPMERRGPGPPTGNGAGPKAQGNPARPG